MTHRLSQTEIQTLQDDVLNILSKLESLKYRIASHDQRQLVNHLQYTLTTLRNMSNTVAVEKSDPYNVSHNDYTSSNLSGKKVQYNPNGTTRIIDPVAVHTTGDGWENQFNESLLIKPPCYMMPPQSLTSIPQLRQASEYNRLSNLTQPKRR